MLLELDVAPRLSRTRPEVCKVCIMSSSFRCLLRFSVLHCQCPLPLLIAPRFPEGDLALSPQVKGGKKRNSHRGTCQVPDNSKWLFLLHRWTKRRKSQPLPSFFQSLLCSWPCLGGAFASFSYSLLFLRNILLSHP